MLGTRSFQKRNYFIGRRILVTGATGLLGSHLVQTLIDLGAEVVTLIRDRPPASPFFIWNLADRSTVVQGDTRDERLLFRILTEYQVDLVFHLAAQTIVRDARENPAETFDVNLMGTVRLLEATRRTGREIRVVAASSDKAYGPAQDLPYTEETPLRPEHPYDASKACADLAAVAFAKTYDLPIAVTRCGNLFGGGDLNWNRLVPGTIRSVLKKESPVIRSDGHAVRDYLYVKDAVIAYLNLAFALSREEIRGETFNFSNEDPREVLEVVKEILAIAGHPDLEPTILDLAKDEIPAQQLSSGKAHRLLGFSSRLSLAEGLRETYEWYRSHLSSGD